MGETVDRSRQALGAWGERAAERWYRQRGWSTIDRNWRCSDGEVDLIVGRDGCVAFVEVKTRSTGRFGPPTLAVGWSKQRRIRAVAARWLREHPGSERHVRFDVVAIEAGRVEVIEGAF